MSTQSISLTPFRQINFPENAVGKTLKNHQKYDISFQRNQEGSITCNYEKHGIVLGKNVPLIISNNMSGNHIRNIHPYLVTVIEKGKGVVIGKYGLMGGGSGNSKAKLPEDATQDDYKKNIDKLRNIEKMLKSARMTKGPKNCIEVPYSRNPINFNEKNFSDKIIFSRISDKLLIESKNTPYFLINSADNQFIGFTRIETMSSDFRLLYEDLEAALGGCSFSLLVNTGTHGTPDGKTLFSSQDPDYKICNDPDVEFLQSKNNVKINIVDLTTDVIYKENFNFIINSFCFSSEIYKTSSVFREFFPEELISNHFLSDKENERIESLQRERLGRKNIDSIKTYNMYRKILSQQNVSLYRDKISIKKKCKCSENEKQKDVYLFDKTSINLIKEIGNISCECNRSNNLSELSIEKNIYQKGLKLFLLYKKSDSKAVESEMEETFYINNDTYKYLSIEIVY